MSNGDIVHGTVASVDAIPLGSELAAAANVGDTLLTVVDVADFWAGTRLNLNGVVYPYTTVDDTAQTVLLSTPVTTAGVVSDAVQVWDNRANLPAVTTEATVIAQGDSSAGDPIMAVVAPGVIPFLPLGVRDPANAGDAENVMLEEVNGVWHVKALAGSSMAPTLTAATIQTAPDGLRMWMSGQPAILGTASERASLLISTGLAAETTPGQLSLVYNADVANTSAPLTTGGAVTSLPVAATTFAIPNGATVALISTATEDSQFWTVTADVAAGATSVPVASQTPNFAYPTGSVLEVAGALPDATTTQADVAIIPPVFSDTPHKNPNDIPTVRVRQYTGGAGSKSMAQINADNIYLTGQGSATNDGAIYVYPQKTLTVSVANTTPGGTGTGYQIQADLAGVRIGEHTATNGLGDVKGIVRGNDYAATTDSGGYIAVNHGLTTTPVFVDAVPYMSRMGVGIQITLVNLSGFTLRFYDTSTLAPLASTAVGYMWYAIA